MVALNEIVLFDDLSSPSTSTSPYQASGARGRGNEKRNNERRWNHEGDTGGGIQKDEVFDGNVFLGRLLEYLETPQYLRKSLFPMHRDLRLAGLLPPLDCPHHLRREDNSPFREGVVTAPHAGAYANDSANTGIKRKRSAVDDSESADCWVDVGLGEPIQVAVEQRKRSSKKKGGGIVRLPEVGTRVTVKMPDDADDTNARATLSSPTQPKTTLGLYWGYNVRIASTLSSVFTECPYLSPSPSVGTGAEEEDGQKVSGGYDLLIGTSERGRDVQQILSEIPKFRHALIIFGGLSGLELAIESDPILGLRAEDSKDLFDFWVNICPGQGSRTIRTEEALPIALSLLKSALERQGARNKPSAK